MVRFCWELTIAASCVIANFEMKLTGPGQVTPLLQFEVVASEVQIRDGKDSDIEPQEGPLQARSTEAGIP